jgi:hypothetical protein
MQYCVCVCAVAVPGRLDRPVKKTVRENAIAARLKGFMFDLHLDIRAEARHQKLEDRNESPCTNSTYSGFLRRIRLLWPRDNLLDGNNHDQAEYPLIHRRRSGAELHVPGITGDFRRLKVAAVHVGAC